MRNKIDGIKLRNQLKSSLNYCKYRSIIVFLRKTYYFPFSKIEGIKLRELNSNLHFYKYRSIIVCLRKIYYFSFFQNQIGNKIKKLAQQQEFKLL